MVECICKAYSVQYRLPINIVRLTQTFGPGVEYNDGRVFAEFARCLVEHRDIILHTKGETKRNYLYTADAVRAILIVLLKGESGEAYNAANDQTYCSIYEMAKLVADIDKANPIDVKVEIEDLSNFGYAPTLKMNLDISKIKGLGFKPQTPLVDMFTRMIEFLQRKVRNMPKVSILLAIYNGADAIRKSIGCLQKQTLKDIEIVCVDDNSTDNSLEIINELKKG